MIRKTRVIGIAVAALLGLAALLYLGGLLGQLLAGGKPLGQGGKCRAALGQLLFLRFQRQPAGGSVGQSVQLLFIGSKLCSQLFQLGALLCGLRPGQLCGVPGSALLAAEPFQLVIGGQVPDLLNVKNRGSGRRADKDTFGCLTRDKLSRTF